MSRYSIVKTKRKTQGGQALWVIAGMNFGGGSSGSKRSASSSPFQQQHSSGPHHCETASVHYHLPAERQPNLFDPMNGPSAHTIISWLPRLSKSRQLTCQKGKASSLQQSLRFLFTLVLAACCRSLIANQPNDLSACSHWGSRQDTPPPPRMWKDNRKGTDQDPSKCSQDVI